MKPLLRGALALALGLVLAPRPLPALVFWNLDNSANQSDPGSGVPWNSVARVSGTNLSLANTLGSAVYLGNGYMLTATHVTLSFATTTLVTFDGVNSFAVDMTYNGGTGFRQVASGVDMSIFHLSSAPSVSAVNLYNNVSIAQIANATVIGYGVGRDGTSLSSSVVGWSVSDNNATVAKRWGINVPKQLQAISYTFSSYSFNYTAIQTVAGSSTGTPAGVGNNEAAVTVNDSGGGLFQQISGTWYLVGLTTAQTNKNGSFTSTFGNDAVSGNGTGDSNFFVPIATYESTITALVPEPRTVGLLMVAVVLWFFARVIRSWRTARRCG